MRKAIREIKRGFSEKLYTDTNTPIMLSSHDKLVSSLANDINVELKELQKQKHHYFPQHNIIPYKFILNSFAQRPLYLFPCLLQVSVYCKESFP